MATASLFVAGKDVTNLSVSEIAELYDRGHFTIDDLRTAGLSSVVLYIENRDRSADSRGSFLNDLDTFIRATRARPRFKGQTQVIRNLERIRNLSALR